MLTRLNVRGRIKAIMSENSAALLKNLMANEETFPKGGLPITRYFLSCNGLKSKKSCVKNLYTTF